jgi:hypothetical protein
MIQTKQLIIEHIIKNVEGPEGSTSVDGLTLGVSKNKEATDERDRTVTLESYGSQL